MKDKNTKVFAKIRRSFAKAKCESFFFFCSAKIIYILNGVPEVLIVQKGPYKWFLSQTFIF